MIYLKEPNTNRIVKFQSEASIGAGFANWTRLTESEILAYELEQAKASKIAQCKAYLSSTDWEHTAFVERGRPYDEVKAKRLVAVNLQNDIAREDITLEELENININF